MWIYMGRSWHFSQARYSFHSGVGRTLGPSIPIHTRIDGSEQCLANSGSLYIEGEFFPLPDFLSDLDQLPLWVLMTHSDQSMAWAEEEMPSSVGPGHSPQWPDLKSLLTDLLNLLLRPCGLNSQILGCS